jgi:hypothetical protein
MDQLLAERACLHGVVSTASPATTSTRPSPFRPSSPPADLVAFSRGTSFFTIVGTLRLSVTGLEMLPYEVWGIVHSVMALLATLFLHATYIFVFSTSVEIAVAINIIRNGPLAPPLRAVRNFAQALCVILALLAIITFALYLRVVIGNDVTLGRTVTRLTAAITVMLLVTAVITLPFSVALITRATYPQDARQVSLPQPLPLLTGAP